MREPIHTTSEGKGRIGAGWRAALLAPAVGGMAVAVEAPALAQPEPPRFEAFVLERVEPRNGFDDYGYTVWTLADDGTVYGSVNDRRQRSAPIKSRFGEGTTWLLPRDPSRIEVRPIAASVHGVVLLYVFGWPQDYIYVPDRGGRQLNNLHPDIFVSDDLNNDHEITGAVGVSPNNRGVIYRYATGFEYLENTQSSGDSINDRGSVLGHLGSTSQGLDMRVWHGDGRVSDFVLPTNSGQASQSFNNADEGCGKYFREDSTGNNRYGGWFWSERTGLVEIPFRYEYPKGGFDVQIYGISDDGWVLGEEHFSGSEGEDYFLWHVDAGFFNLGDLYDWQGRFAYPAGGHQGAVNGPGQMAISTFSLASNRGVHVLLNPIK